MSDTPLYPLKFTPITQYRLWGGRRFENLISTPLPEGPVGEAWILSDRNDFPSVVSEGSLQGSTIKEIIEKSKDELFGSLAASFERFPLLLKFLDAREMLSVQVHPSDSHTAYLPVGERGKTEAWYVIEAGPEAKIYAGLNHGTNPINLGDSLADGTYEEHLASFTPKPGEGVLIPAGTVHALGSDVMVFEVQQNSDVTFRLFDWDRVDPKTGARRELQINEAIAVTKFDQGPVQPVVPDPSLSKQLMFESEHFKLWRTTVSSPFDIGEEGVPTILVCIEGATSVKSKDGSYDFGKGEVMLLPASLGVCSCEPKGEATVLEIAIPVPKP